MKSKSRTYNLWPQFPYLTKSELQELLLARLAGGDLHAMEEYQKWKKADMLLDRLRAKPIYTDCTEKNSSSMKRDCPCSEGRDRHQGGCP